MNVADVERTFRLVTGDLDIGLIARDLHDGPIQDVYASMLRLTHLAQIADEPLRTELMNVAALQSRTISNMRSICRGRTLYSSEDRRFDDTLSDIIRDASIGLGFDPTVSIDPAINEIADEHLQADVACTLRECLSNVARHSFADGADVNVSVSGGQLSLKVADNGGGISDHARRGNGLNNLRDRAARHGGTCAFDSRPDGGTIVTWTVDVPRGQYGSTGGPEESAFFKRVAAV